MNTAVSFNATYFGDGSTTVYVLDISKDPYYFTQTDLSPNFDKKLYPSAVIGVSAKNALNGTDYGPVSVSITQSQITFTLTTAPASGARFTVAGYIQY
jgi:hypothetical protein